MAKVSLVLEFNNRVMTIPFKDISLLDEFTVSCSDKDELTNKLKDVYDITITGNIYKADIQYILNFTRNGNARQFYRMFLDKLSGKYEGYSIRASVFQIEEWNPDYRQEAKQNEKK